MRHFLLVLAFLTLGVVGVAGFRGIKSRRPPLYIFPDMKRQPRLRPQTSDGFFDNGLSSRLPVPGTVPRSEPIPVGDRFVYSWHSTSPPWCTRAEFRCVGFGWMPVASRSWAECSPKCSCAT